MTEHLDGVRFREHRITIPSQFYVIETDIVLYSHVR